MSACPEQRAARAFSREVETSAVVSPASCAMASRTGAAHVSPSIVTAVTVPATAGTASSILRHSAVRILVIVIPTVEVLNHDRWKSLPEQPVADLPHMNICSNESTTP